MCLLNSEMSLVVLMCCSMRLSLMVHPLFVRDFGDSSREKGRNAYDVE